MSLLERIEAAGDGGEIEPGKRLIRAGDDNGLSLFGRLGYGLHRLAWRTPFHAFRIRGRMPLRLLAVPKDPVAGDKAAGEALLDGMIVHGSFRMPADALDFADPSLPPDAADYLHSFAWLRDLAAAATRERAAPIAERLTSKWLGAHARQIAEPAWRPDLWGRRMLFWSAYAPYILSSDAAVYRTLLLKTMASGARHLERCAGKTAQDIHRIAAWTGVIAAALVVQGGPARLKSGEAGLARALSTALHDDGGLVSRSPLQQLRLVELLGQLRAVYLAAKGSPPEWLSETLESVVAALLTVILGDEALSNWQGGNMASRRQVLAAIEGAGVAARPLRQPRGWGYHRLQAKGTAIVFDAAPPPPPRALSGGCASSLAFELSDGAHRMIVNCGGAGDGPAGLPAPLIRALRTTAAHSTLTLSDRNSTAIHEDGSLGRGVSQIELSREEGAGILRIEASHDGYSRRFGLIHERRLELSADGAFLTGEDRLVRIRRRLRHEAASFAVRFHLAPNVETAVTANGRGALLRNRGGSAWQFRCRGGAIGIEDSIWIDGDSIPHATRQIVISGETPPDGITISWEFKRAG